MPILVLLGTTGATAETEAEADRFCTTLAGTERCIGVAEYSADVCGAIAAFARRWDLPEGFFARLIWQESRFDALAISPAGAQGIAQFMPGTADLRNLDNPFDPSEALARSAEYLSVLETRFGNLGLAAAAYNSGEGRISRYLGAGGGVPRETRDYVAIVTGLPIEAWTGTEPEDIDFALHPERPFEEACIDMASAVPMPETLTGPGQWQPWGVLLYQAANADTARRAFVREQTAHADILEAEDLLLLTVRNPSFGARVRFSAMVGRPTRAEAQELCADLLAAGGNCMVTRNE